MKHFKKFFVCLMAMVVLCSSQMAYVNAAETEVMPMSSDITQVATKGGVTVTFHFHYSDGRSATFTKITYDESSYEKVSGPTSYFAGDTCYASVTLKNRITGATVTLNAWCDIYGDSGYF